MRILAVESSAKSASVAIAEDTRILAEVFLNNGLTHSRTIMPMIESLIKMTGIGLDSIDRIAVAAGPGSFTGLRIGVSAVKGLSFATGIPCCGVSTLEAMAHNMLHVDGLICAVMDARAGQVYNALFRASDGVLTRLTEDRAISSDELFSEIKNEKNVYILGDGAKLCYNTFGEKTDGLKLAPGPLILQSARGVALSALDAVHVAAQDLSVRYIRLPQAERERLKRLKETGELKQ